MFQQIFVLRYHVIRHAVASCSMKCVALREKNINQPIRLQFGRTSSLTAAALLQPSAVINMFFLQGDKIGRNPVKHWLLGRFRPMSERCTSVNVGISMTYTELRWADGM